MTVALAAALKMDGIACWNSYSCQIIPFRTNYAMSSYDLEIEASLRRLDHMTAVLSPVNHVSSAAFVECTFAGCARMRCGSEKFATDLICCCPLRARSQLNPSSFDLTVKPTEVSQRKVTGPLTRNLRDMCAHARVRIALLSRGCFTAFPFDFPLRSGVFQ